MRGVPREDSPAIEVIVRVLVMAVIGVVLLACSDSTSPAVITGTYPLRTYRYQRLPVVVSESMYESVRITGGSITLNGDLTFKSSYTFEKYLYGNLSTPVVTCSGYWTPTETSPQGGQLMTLTEASTPGCGDRAIAEWDRHNRLTIVWTFLGDTQHAR